jgi:hypothetical protein
VYGKFAELTTFCIISTTIINIGAGRQSQILNTQLEPSKVIFNIQSGFAEASSILYVKGIVRLSQNDLLLPRRASSKYIMRYLPFRADGG